MASRRFSPLHHADVERTGERQHRYRLVVLGVGLGDVVESIGGFLCDRARAGWEVSVFLDLPCGQPRDARPLSILGIAAQELVTDAGPALRTLSRGGALAVGADLLARDAGVRDEVSRMVNQGLTEVTVWGRPAPGESGRALDPAPHPLSAAARAFKAHALLAAGIESEATEPIAVTETLFRPRGQTFRRLYSI